VSLLGLQTVNRENELLDRFVLPPQGPELGDPPDGFQRFREPLEDRPGYQWVAEMFRAYRLPARADAAVPA
jgi:hypothetical protein